MFEVSVLNCLGEKDGVLKSLRNYLFINNTKGFSVYRVKFYLLKFEG